MGRQAHPDSERCSGLEIILELKEFLIRKELTLKGVVQRVCFEVVAELVAFHGDPCPVFGGELSRMAVLVDHESVEPQLSLIIEGYVDGPRLANILITVDAAGNRCGGGRGIRG